MPMVSGSFGASKRRKCPNVDQILCGSQASGIIEYLADGSWTKRLHAGWAAHAGVVAAYLAQAGFTSPRTVFEGTHGFYQAFGGERPSAERLGALGEGLDADAPFIVKAVWEHGSLGLDESSVVKGSEVARAIAERTERFGTAHFAEGYVEGREFNLALLEERGRPRALPIAEIVFEDWREGAPRIVGYDAKWTSDSAAYAGTPRRFGLEQEEPVLAAKLAKLAKSCWDLFNLAGYARVDFRVDGRGEPWILEVNVNPCLNPDAGFAAAAAASGLSYRHLIGRIIDAAPRALQAIA